MFFPLLAPAPIEPTRVCNDYRSADYSKVRLLDDYALTLLPGECATVYLESGQKLRVKVDKRWQKVSNSDVYKVEKKKRPAATLTQKPGSTISLKVLTR